MRGRPRSRGRCRGAPQGGPVASADVPEAFPVRRPLDAACATASRVAALARSPDPAESGGRPTPAGAPSGRRAAGVRSTAPLAATGARAGRPWCARRPGSPAGPGRPGRSPGTIEKLEDPHGRASGRQAAQQRDRAARRETRRVGPEVEQPSMLAQDAMGRAGTERATRSSIEAAVERDGPACHPEAASRRGA
jgi:hypothetical protein